MAKELRTGRLVFASDTMADYRDIVAAKEYRCCAVSQLINFFLAGDYREPFELGWIDPASETPSIVQGFCRTRGIP
ncbi:MAG: hypothetical protein M3362_27500, partial [Acidobacteriota bacterium]|nr:hypothetical protein [Acidobacteriota bacterium]